MFEAVADVLILLVNGAYSLATGVFSLRTLLVITVGVCLFWLAAVELESLDRRAYKPVVRPH